MVFTAVPIAILAGILFYNMEKNVVSEHRNYMEYKSQQSLTQIQTGMDSLNMSTQFFLEDDQMLNMLNNTASGESISTEEIISFKETDITNLERLVNVNPLLYLVRIYAATDNVQEMMPILYSRSRMDQMEWAGENMNFGWHFGYYDTTFSSLIVNQQDELAGLITPINDYWNGQIGVVEASMKMETLFPCMYEDTENEWACLLIDDGTICYGKNAPEQTEGYLEELKALWTGQSDEEQSFYTRILGRRLVVTYLPIQEMGAALVEVKDITGDVGDIYRMRNIFVLVMIGVLVVLYYVVNRSVMRMLRQFYVILAAVQKVQKGNLDTRIEVVSSDEMGELSVQMNTMFEHIENLMQENINREVLVKNSQIRALQNQINAHFIYNVLESIKMMAEIDEEYEISDAITSLGKLLRYSMKWVSGNVLLREELEYIRNYLALINLRYDFNVYLSLGLPDILMDQEIPKMSLQPIVENSILHGIEPLAEDSTIYIKGWMEAGNCIIEVSDTGIGMDEQELEKLRAKIAGKIEVAGGKGNGIGLKNVQDRIQVAFGAKYGLILSSRKGCYTKVAIRLPRK
jgi:two-component system sensor histidine kinase YesM